MIWELILGGKKVKDVVEVVVNWLEKVKEEYGEEELIKLMKLEGKK